MRTAKEFNTFYKKKDPWGVLKSNDTRNIIIKKIIEKYQTKKTNYGNCSAHPHNNYIQWLTESGLIGFIFFIIFIINLFKPSLKEIYRESNKISLITLLVIFWPIMSTGSFLKNWNGIETFFVIGIAMVLTKKMKKNNDK